MVPDPLQAFVAPSLDAAPFASTLRPGIEERLIVIAHGKEFHNDEMHEFIRVPDALLIPPARKKEGAASFRGRPALALTTNADGTRSYLNLKQGVQYTIRNVTTKPDFEKYLNTEAVHLLYTGHARWGRGPCFGRGKTPSEEWEEGDGTNTGLFRMGLPFLALPVSEILEHGYTANLVKAAVTMAEADCDPDFRPYLKSVKPRTLAEIHPKIAAQARDKDPNAKFWSFIRFRGEDKGMHVVLHAGWNNTTSKPHEIGSHEPKCRVFCHFGCSTQRHNHDVLRKLKGWRREGNERYAYFTSNLSDGWETVYWLYHLLTYSEASAFQSWEPSLEYARKKTNADLSRDGQVFGIR